MQPMYAWNLLQHFSGQHPSRPHTARSMSAKEPSSMVWPGVPTIFAKFARFSRSTFGYWGSLGRCTLPTEVGGTAYPDSLRFSWAPSEEIFSRATALLQHLPGP